MSVVSVREVRIGAGRPKIIVPIFAAHEAEAAARAKALADTAADLAELRLDPLREADGSLPDTDALCRAVGAVRDALPKCLPLLVTMRTAAEGGERAYDPGDYAALLKGKKTAQRLLAAEVAARLGNTLRPELEAALA